MCLGSRYNMTRFILIHRREVICGLPGGARESLRAPKRVNLSESIGVYRAQAEVFDGRCDGNPTCLDENFVSLIPYACRRQLSGNKHSTDTVFQLRPKQEFIKG